MGINFLAIDFETATAARNSTCEIGLTEVVDGEIVSSFSRLIRPLPNLFHYFNTKIHGISAEKVENEPEFDKVWEDLSAGFEGKHLIAHNAAFDMGVLRAVCKQFNLPLPDCHYSCSVQIAKKAWLERTSYSLDKMARELNLNFEHHQAGDDSRICAEIVLAAAEMNKAGSLDELLQRLKVSKNHLSDKPEQRKLKTSRILKPKIYPDASSHPFYRKEVVFTGKMQSMSRRIAQEKVLQQGGFYTKSITDQTSFLVVGGNNYHNQPSTKKSAKLKYGLELVAAGQKLTILDEEAFLDLLNDDQKDGLQLKPLI